MSDFQWIGKEIKCPYQTLNTGKYKFYSSFAKGNETYKLGEFVKINRINKQNPKLDEVCRLMCLYESFEERHEGAPLKGFVQPYMFAQKLHRTLSKFNIHYDEGNEIIEDHDSIDVIINLQDIKWKCTVIFATAKDPIYFIAKNKLDKNCNFSCRYKQIGGDIVPLYPDSSSSDGSFCEPNEEIRKKSDKKFLKKNTVDKDELKFTSKNNKVQNSTPTKRKKKTAEHLYVSLENISLTNGTPDKLHTNSAEKNVCNSVENYLNSSVVTTYSIISDSSDGEDLKIKLKVSKKTGREIVERLSLSDSPRIKDSDTVQKKSINSLSPVVYLEKSSPQKKNSGDVQKRSISSPRPIVYLEKSDLSDISMEDRKVLKKTTEHSDYRHEKENDSGKQPAVRRSRRVTERVCYADFFPPIEASSFKRSRPLPSCENKNNKENIDSNNLIHVTEVNSETDEETVPKKQRRAAVNTSKYFYYESDTDSGNDNDSNLIITGKRQVKPKKIYSLVATDETTRLSNTPKTPKSRSKGEKDISRSVQKCTPVNRVKLLRNGEITPSLQSRNSAPVLNTTPLMKARSQLHVSYIPKALPCREKEYRDIYNFIEAKLSDCCGGCMYVSGVPGTGKTATVTSAINNLLLAVKSNDVTDFEFVSINGMKLTEPRQAYVEILKQLAKQNKTVPWEQAQTMLNEKFTKPKKEKTPVVLLVDELDILCTKRQDVVYNLLDWPTKAKRPLIVITIANTMDLPERLLMSRVTSRLGLTRLTFQAYTHKQLQEIVTKRLTGINSFNPDAVQLVARKVASVSGDARRALDICRRAAEIAELEGADTYVTMTHVNEALNAMITQPKVQAIKRCSRLEQFILQSIVAENERTGVEETVFRDVFKMLTSVFALYGFPAVSCGLALAAVNRLSACRLLIADQKCSDINQRIILNVSNDDVYYALKKD